MIKQKKGLSTVVTTLIIILLVLVAVGIIWIVVRGVIETGTSEIDYGAKCFSTDVRATSAACAATCDVDLYRKRGSDEIGGVYLVFHEDGAGETSEPYDAAGDIGILSTSPLIGIAPVGITAVAGIDSVDVIAYYTDEQGEAFLCSSQINPYAIS